MLKQIGIFVAGYSMLAVVAYFAAKTCPLLDDEVLPDIQVHTSYKPEIREVPVIETPDEPGLVLALPALEPGVESDEETIELPETPFLGKDISILEDPYRSEVTR